MLASFMLLSSLCYLEFFCYIYKLCGKLAPQAELEIDFSVLHISSPLKELVKQKRGELNIWNKEEGPNLRSFVIFYCFSRFLSSFCC